MNDRKVMQQALEALEYLAARPDYETGKAITALRARLAEPQTCKPGLQVEGAEPVAWMLALPDGRLERMSVTSFDDEAEEMLARSIAGCAMVPLYTAPPTRSPLTPVQEAAPELLGALRDMLAIVKDSRGVAGYHLNGATAEWDEFDEVDAARAAIAKAEGGNDD